MQSTPTICPVHQTPTIWCELHRAQFCPTCRQHPEPEYIGTEPVYHRIGGHKVICTAQPICPTHLIGEWWCDVHEDHFCPCCDGLACPLCSARPHHR